MVALLSCFYARFGRIIRSLRTLYDYGWFVVFGIAFFVNWSLMVAVPPKRSRHRDTERTE